MPKGQDISYNVIYGTRKQLEVRETYYQENGERITLGDNWYTDINVICPKINANNLKFTVKPVGKNTFTASFLDSKGNIVSLLPDRQLTVQVNNGQRITLTISGGFAVFHADAENGDDIKATVDNSDRFTKYDENNNGKYVPQENSPAATQDYPSISYDDLYDMGVPEEGNGGTGHGNGGAGDGSGEGHGKTNPNSQSDGNATTSQNQNPINSPDNHIGSVSQTNGASNSPISSDSGSAAGQSVVKQIIIDEDEFFKVTGISFIILLIISTIGFYYREDIREMKSKCKIHLFLLFL